eukprot:2806945-Pyramimonas_sp.AAC.1
MCKKKSKASRSSGSPAPRLVVGALPPSPRMSGSGCERTQASIVPLHDTGAPLGFGGDFVGFGGNVPGARPLLLLPCDPGIRTTSSSKMVTLLDMAIDHSVASDWESVQAIILGDKFYR